MTTKLATIALGLTATLGLLSAGATSAAAQIICPLPIWPGPPPIDQNHIFCGDINAAGNAVGFHSRPGGVNPVLTNGVAAVVGGFVTVPPGAPAGIYRLNNFTINTLAGGAAVKAFSTMFPDHCSQANVLAAIANAAAGAAPGAFLGMSGPTCQAGVPPAPFPITGFINAAGVVVTAYPQ
jgi:Bacterial EndoU nuclease